MVGIGGPDEPVVGGTEPFLHALEDIGVAGGQLGGGDAELGGRLRHLQAVHIGAGEVAHVVAVETLEPGDGVGGDVLVGVTDVRIAVGVGDGSGDVERGAWGARPRAGERRSHLALTLGCGS